MANIAAIRWLTRGRYKPPVIQYMLLDERLDYLISPREILVNHLDTNLKQLFFALEKFSQDVPLEIHYKSIVKGYWTHRKDSAKFHRLINRYLKKKKLLNNSNKTAFLLKKEQLKHFKNALSFLDIDCKSKGEAYVAHLWTIAFKVTKGRMLAVIKQIWKSRYGIKRMTKETAVKFSEFYSHI